MLEELPHSPLVVAAKVYSFDLKVIMFLVLCIKIEKLRFFVCFKIQIVGMSSGSAMAFCKCGNAFHVVVASLCHYYGTANRIILGNEHIIGQNRARESEQDYTTNRSPPASGN